MLNCFSLFSVSLFSESIRSMSFRSIELIYEVSSEGAAAAAYFVDVNGCFGKVEED